MTVPKSDLQPGTLNATHRWQYSRFSFGGDQSAEYQARHEATFGKQPSKFCGSCGLRWSWCECTQPDETPPEGEEPKR